VKAVRVIQSKSQIKLWTDHVPVDDMALQQIMNISNLPFIYKHIAIMPDVHYGVGATVGSVIPTKGAIIPAAVGVDIGCGMMAAKTSLTAQDLPDNLFDLRTCIEAAIPVGLKEFSDDTVPSESAGIFDEATYNTLIQKHPQIQTKKHPIRQIGTLGSGNHFVELCLDKAKTLWVMLHSGSRGVGNKIGTYFIDRAKEEINKHGIMGSLLDKDLSYFVEHTTLFDDYIEAMEFAQRYAYMNRETMMAIIRRV
jgi:tRNA-splicing ligase RtcB